MRQEEKTLKVSEHHIWVGVRDQHGLIGLTNYSQTELGQVLSVDLPEVGDEVEKGEGFGEIESVETVYELIAPISGTVLSVNGDLETHPSLINEDPYNEGWLIEVKVGNASEVESLMDMDEYYHFVFRVNPR